MKPSVKVMQTSHSNAWLTLAKNQSPQVYERLAKVLEAWEKDEQDKVCYQKVTELLRHEPALADALNVYV